MRSAWWISSCRRFVARLADRRTSPSTSRTRPSDFLAGREVGYDPVYGARPLKRVIQKALQDPLAERLLSGVVKDGETVIVGAGPDGLIVGDVARGASQEARATVH